MSVDKLLRSTVRVVNIGLPGFAAELRKRGVAVVQLDWTPPAGGNERLIRLLDRLGSNSAPGSQPGSRPGPGE